MNANIETEDQLLDEKQYLSVIEKDKSSYCKDQGSSKRDNGYNQDSYKNDSSCENLSSSVTTTQEFEVAITPKMYNLTSLFESMSSEKNIQ